MKQFSKKTAVIAISVLLLQGCVESSDPNARSDQEIVDSQPESDGSRLMNISGKIFSIPSPVETALLIESSGAGYDASLPNSTQNLNNYVSEFDKSLVLGIYGANLAYTAIFEKNQEALTYLNAIEKISTSLNLSNAVDAALIRRFSTNLGNRDSMLVLSSTFFRASDAYLKENERDDVSAFILIGGWIEGMYLAYNSANENKAIQQRIAEQKKTLQNIIGLLDNQESTENLDQLKSKLTTLQKTYDGISSTYEYQRPETNSAQKNTVLKSETRYTITTEQFNTIGTQIEAIRNHIVG